MDKNHQDIEEWIVERKVSEQLKDAKFNILVKQPFVDDEGVVNPSKFVLNFHKFCFLIFLPLYFPLLEHKLFAFYIAERICLYMQPTKKAMFRWNAKHSNSLYSKQIHFILRYIQDFFYILLLFSFYLQNSGKQRR